MKTLQIFYSWQSDLPNRTNRGFIGGALERAAKSIRLDTTLKVEPVLDRDTLGEPGSPDIASAIFKKIDKAAAFVADISLVCLGGNGRPSPNPNVLIELGYALKALTAQRIIMVFNLAFGDVSDLPFDLRSRRVLTYRMAEDDEPASARGGIQGSLRAALVEVCQQAGSAEELSRNSKFASELVSQLVGILVFGEEAPRRELNPWLDEVGEVFKPASRWLRNATAANLAEELGLATDMENLAFLLDSVVRHEHAFGNHEEYYYKVSQVVNAATSLREKVFQHGPLDESSRAKASVLLSDLSRRLHSWILRIDTTVEVDHATFEEFLVALTDVGYQLTQLSYYPVNWPTADFGIDLRKIGQTLHLVDHDNELNQYGDEEQLVEEATALDKELQSLARMEQGS